VTDSQISRNNHRNEMHPRLVTCIAQLSNTGPTWPTSSARPLSEITPAAYLPLDCRPLRFNSVVTKTPTLAPCLCNCLAGFQSQVPLRTRSIQRCASDPPRQPQLQLTFSYAFEGDLSLFIFEDTLITFFAPLSPIHYVCRPSHLLCIPLLSLIHMSP
jgi:hypothetical protein